MEHYDDQYYPPESYDTQQEEETGTTDTAADYEDTKTNGPFWGMIPAQFPSQINAYCKGLHAKGMSYH